MSRKRKACLIKPPVIETFRFSTGSASLPLGIAYIAASLQEQGFEIQIVDALSAAPQKLTRHINGSYQIGLRLEEIAERVSSDATLVGISVIFTHEWPQVARLVSLLKERNPHQPIVLGGEHVTSMPEFCLATSLADFVCLGEGEETIIELAEAIVQEQQDFGKIPGIGFRDGNKVKINPRRSRRKDVDAIPLPAWDLFDIKTYFQHGFVGGTDANELTMPILATRGCPYQCTFCSSPNMWTTNWIARTPARVVDEMELYHRKYGANNFPFQDLTAIIKKGWIMDFCNELIRRNLKVTWQFPSGTRSEAIDDEVAERLLRSGMANLAYAPESGSERTRALIKKKMKTANLLRSVESAVKNNLNISLFLVIGFPHDTVDDLRENMKFLKTVRGLGIRDLPISFFMALPGTQLFDTLYEQGVVKIDTKYFSHILQGSKLYPMKSYCDALSRLQLGYWKLKFFLYFYLICRKVVNTGAQTDLAISGALKRGHTSRLQTAIRGGVVNFFKGIKVSFAPRWISRQEEEAMMSTWHGVFDAIRRQKKDSALVQGLPSAHDELHKFNMAAKVKYDHSKFVEVALHRE